MKKPKNESKTHFNLKIAAAKFLKEVAKCDIIFFEYKPYRKKIKRIDVVGLNTFNQVVYGIECKATKADLTQDKSLKDKRLLEYYNALFVITPDTLSTLDIPGNLGHLTWDGKRIKTARAAYPVQSRKYFQKIKGDDYKRICAKMTKLIF